jgi:hypothetical protein
MVIAAIPAKTTILRDFFTTKLLTAKLLKPFILKLSLVKSHPWRPDMVTWHV